MDFCREVLNRLHQKREVRNSKETEMKTVITNTLDGSDILVDGDRIAALGTPAMIRSMA